jgi:Ca-activated chloride channel family protein
MKLGLSAALVLLVVVPVLFALLSRDKRSRSARLLLLGDAALLARQESGADARPRALRLQIAAVVVLIVALAGPRIGSHTELLPRRGLDVVFALDVSRSMRARDVTPDRLERAKAEISAFIDEIGENRVALVAFAGTAFVQCPLTTDTEAVRTFARGLTPELVPQGGTALALGLETAARVFEAENETKDGAVPRGRVLVVFTDGEDHEGGVENAATRLRALGVETFVIGLGSSLGEPIPVTDTTGAVTDYVKDREGRTVVSRMSPDILSLVAERTGGRFIDGTREPDLGLATVSASISRMEKRELEARVRTTYEDRSEWPLALALALLFFSVVAPHRRRTRRAPPAVVMSALVVVIPVSFAADARAQLFERVEPEIAEGVDAMQRGDGEAAVERFRRAKTRTSDESAVVEYNVGSVHLRAAERMSEDEQKTPGANDPGGERAAALKERFDAAEQAFERAASLSSNKALRSDAHLARGNAKAVQGDLKSAVDAFRDALVENPENGAARRNLRAALTLMRSQPPPPPSNENQESDDEKKEDGEQEQQEQQGGGKSGGEKEESAEESESDPGEGQGESGDEKREERDPKDGEGENENKGERASDDEKGTDAKERGAGEQKEQPKDDEKSKGSDARESLEKPPEGEKKPMPAPGDSAREGQGTPSPGSKPVDDKEKQEARRLLDAMRRNERPLQPFQMRGEQRRLLAPEKDW